MSKTIRSHTDNIWVAGAEQKAFPRVQEFFENNSWIVLLGASCTSFCTFGWINSIGTFQNYYESSLLKEYSPSTIAWIPSLQIFFMMFMGPLIGYLYDVFGHCCILLAGTVLHVLGLFTAASSHRYYQLLLSQGVCSGIGAAAIFLPTLPVVKERFAGKEAEALAMVTTGSSIGGVIFPIMTSHLIDKVGFKWSMGASAFLNLFLLVIANLVFAVPVFLRWLDSKGSHGSERLRKPSRSLRAQLKETIKILRNDAPFMILVLGLLVYAFGYFAPINYIAAEAVANGVDTNLAQYLIPILNAASFFGRLLSGLAAGKVDPYIVFVAACFITGVLTLAVWTLAATATSRICFAIAFGFFSGAFIALIPALVNIKDNSKNDGFRIGIAFMSASVGGLTTNPICGGIQAKGNGWFGLKCFAGVLSLVGAGIVLSAEIFRIRRERGLNIERNP